MKLLVQIAVDVDVPDSALGGAATPEALADLVKSTCEKRVGQIWCGWGHKVEATVTIVPAGAVAEGGR